jgi:hypothetical protein
VSIQARTWLTIGCVTVPAITVRNLPSGSGLSA